MINRIRLEHANITVNNLEDEVKFFQTAFPHFKIRGGGKSERKWIHLGDEYSYIAINEALEKGIPNEKDYDRIGINHLGFVVDDVREIAENLLKAGYKRDYPKQIERFRIRDYFADKDGNQFEFVEYLTTNLKEMNSYE